MQDLRDFHALLSEKRELINRRIDELLSMGLEQNEAKELVKYTFKTGGKRLRPILVLLACETISDSSVHATDAAVAMEFLHAGSLIFDDLIDRHRFRRNFPTVHRTFAGDKAISAGLFLASRGVQILSEYKDVRITNMVGWGLVDLSKGEILDVISELAVDVDQYLTIADLKTGSLFGASAGIGALLGGAVAHEVDSLYNYGRAVGIAFQIKDDVLDASADPERQERINLVLMQCLEEARKKRRVSTILNSKDSTQGVQIDVLREEATEFALQKSKEHVEKAKLELKELSHSRNTELLEKLADYALEREF